MMPQQQENPAGLTFEDAQRAAKKSSETVVPTLCAMCGPALTRFALIFSCLHCLESACELSCPVMAIDKLANGIVTVDAGTSTGCESCLEACPVSVPRFGVAGTMEKCDCCQGYIAVDADQPHCTATCPTRALFWQKLGLVEKRAAEKGFCEGGRPG